MTIRRNGEKEKIIRQENDYSKFRQLSVNAVYGVWLFIGWGVQWVFLLTLNEYLISTMFCVSPQWLLTHFYCASPRISVFTHNDWLLKPLIQCDTQNDWFLCSKTRWFTFNDWLLCPIPEKQAISVTQVHFDLIGLLVGWMANWMICWLEGWLVVGLLISSVFYGQVFVC